MLRHPLRLAVAVAAFAAATATSPALAHTHASHHGHAYSAWDEQWLMTAIEGDRFEISGGKAAQTKGTLAEVKALGARLVTDHSKSLADAVAVARRLGIKVPKSPSPSEQCELKTVDAFTGATYDRSYADLEVQDHIQDIQETKAEISEGSNAQIRKLARDDLPVLRQHLALARAALNAAGG